MKKTILFAITTMLLSSSCLDNSHKTEQENSKHPEKIVLDPKGDSTENSTKNAEYLELKNNYHFFGKWMITNSIINESYIYEIYNKNDEFIGVIPSYDYKVEKLTKKGINYIVQNNKYGEFYRIDSNKEMILFDQDGELTASGYSASIIK